MYKILDYNRQKDGEKLTHSSRIFHEALEKTISDAVSVLK